MDNNSLHKNCNSKNHKTEHYTVALNSRKFSAIFAEEYIWYYNNWEECIPHVKTNRLKAKNYWTLAAVFILNEKCRARKTDHRLIKGPKGKVLRSNKRFLKFHKIQKRQFCIEFCSKISLKISRNYDFITLIMKFVIKNEQTFCYKSLITLFNEVNNQFSS